MRVATLFLVVLCAAACARVSDEQRAALKLRVDQGATRAAAIDASFAAAMRSLDAAKPTTSSCKVPVASRDVTEFSRDFARWIVMTKGSLGTRQAPFQSEGTTIVEGSEQLANMRSSTGAALVRALERLHDGNGVREAKKKGAELLAEADKLLASPRIELVIVVHATVEPERTDDKTFAPGAAVGRAYLFEAGAGRVVCAGELAAQSSATVSVTTLKGLPSDGKAEVSLDLYQNLMARAEESLRALAP